MKHWILSLIFCLGSSTLFCQHDVIYEVVDKVAEFPGGREAFVKYLQSNIKVPASLENKGGTGKVYVRFIVSETGSISNVQVKKGMPECPECDLEVVRVVEKMPKWIPAKVDGENINSYYTLPVVFDVESDNAKDNDKKKRKDK